MNNMFTSENNVIRLCLTRRKYKNVGGVVVMDAVTNYAFFFFFFFSVSLEYNFILFFVVFMLLLWLVRCFTGALWDFRKQSSNVTNGSSYWGINLECSNIPWWMSTGSVLKVNSSNFLMMMMMPVANPQRYLEVLIDILSIWPCITLLQHTNAWYSRRMVSFLKILMPLLLS